MKIPSPTSVFDSNYVTYRRLWLDTLLTNFSDEMCGKVIDIGGKRENKRGSFRPPNFNTLTWWYLNLDLSTCPDLYADVSNIPIQSESADVVICTEVLEHLKYPSACACEIQRILRPGGVGFISTPFLFPIHADPYDFQRFTDAGLKNLFAASSKVEIWPMGGFWGVLGLFLEIGTSGIDGQDPHQKIKRRSLNWLARRLCIYDLNSFSTQPVSWQKFTSGYFMRVVK